MNTYIEVLNLRKELAEKRRKAECNPRLGMLLCILSAVFVLAFCVTLLLFG